MIIRELRRSDSGLEIVGCVDDDESKRGIRLHGVPVLGTVSELASVLVGCPADEILIAVPSATGKQMQRFTEACAQTGLRFRTVPALRDIIDGHVTIREFRDVDLDDLLGRQPIESDVEFVRQQIERRIVLVTGAAGSIGSELCRQIANLRPAKLICLDQSETGIFYLQRDLQEVHSVDRVFCVADVGDREGIRRIFAEHGPQIIFHAAAYKHVPIMEANVEEAVNNNVFALIDLLDVAQEFRAQNLVLISSDKAVNPNNVMGATKRIGELLLASKPSNSLCCVSVRFGNVLGSSGSVVPIFQEQLRLNQPITITHPEISRFFMTTAEAVSLVLQAFALGDHGNILVLDMGEPVRILDLARTLIRLTGKNEDEAQIRFTGLRKGEKLFEELFYATEEVVDTGRPKVRRARGFQQNWQLLNRQIAELREGLTSHNTARIRENLRKIVPEYTFEASSEDADFEPATRQELHRSARQI
jgi:FlaA1/EpsC-like NDP-sugar epimerase